MRLRLDLPTLVTPLLATILGLQVAYLVTTAYRSHETPVTAAPTAALPQNEAIRAATESLKASTVFGAAGANPQTVVAASSSSLKLAGVLAEDDPTAGQAIISDGGAPARVYRVGAAVSGGLSLHGVYPEYVLLDRGGTLERLDLPRQTAPGGAPAVAPSNAPNTMNIPSAAANTAEAGLANVIRWQAVIRGGQSPGIRVYPGADARAFTRLGLEAGDLIVAINDAPLSDQANGESFLRSLSGMPQASLTIERAGRSQNILIDLASLTTAGAN